MRSPVVVLVPGLVPPNPVLSVCFLSLVQVIGPASLKWQQDVVAANRVASPHIQPHLPNLDFSSEWVAVLGHGLPQTTDYQLI